LKVIALVTTSVFLTGCVSNYVLPSTEQSAAISFDLSSDSTGTTTQNYIVTTYEDLGCTPSKYGTKLESKALASGRERLGPVKVAASGKPFTLAVAYSESRFGQNRGCSFTASFLPQSGASYVVRFASVDQSLACGLKIADGDGSSMSYEAPQMSCAETLAGKVKNGGSGILDWEVRVTP
jgi:hypothetical protein